MLFSLRNAAWVWSVISSSSHITHNTGLLPPTGVPFTTPFSSSVAWTSGPSPPTSFCGAPSISSLRSGQSLCPTCHWTASFLFLRCAIFEALETASFLPLSQKPLCLILLASGRRIGEVANISCIFSENPSSLSLGLVPGFTLSTTILTFNPPVIILGISPPPRSLILVDVFCPFWAIHIYLERSSSWLEDPPLSQHHPFLWSSPSSSRPLSTRSLSNLFISLVKDNRFLTIFQLISPCSSR